LAEVTCPDLVLLDFDLPDFLEGDLISELHHINPQVKTIVFSELNAERTACSAGADVCITKGSSPEVILESFRLLFQLSEYAS
jgi:DNA-binding NarL/FixJ family response regulator